MKRTMTALAALGFGLVSATAGLAGDVRLMWYSDGVEGEVIQDLVNRFMAENPDINVILDNVAYKVVQEQLQIQLEAGQGPDIARVTNLKALASHWLDLTPYLSDPEYWKANFGDHADWMRPDGSEAITGFLTQLTLTGGFANKTLFDQAGVAVPGDEATWDDWIAAATEVQASQGLAAAFAIDRSGHRISGPNVSYGANYIGADGKPAPVDAGTKAFAEKLVAWTDEGKMLKDTWVSAVGLHLSGGGGRLHQRANPVLLFRQLAGRQPLDQDRRRVRLGCDRIALRHRGLFRPRRRRRAGRDQIHQEPRGGGEGVGIPRARGHREGVLRTHPVPARPCRRDREGRPELGDRGQERRTRAGQVHRGRRRHPAERRRAARVDLGVGLLRRAGQPHQPGDGGRVDAGGSLSPRRRRRLRGRDRRGRKLRRQ